MRYPEPVLWRNARLPLAAVALVDLIAVGLLGRRMAALTQRVGQASPESAIQAERLSEADGI